MQRQQKMTTGMKKRMKMRWWQTLRWPPRRRSLGQGSYLWHPQSGRRRGRGKCAWALQQQQQETNDGIRRSLEAAAEKKWKHNMVAKDERGRRPSPHLPTLTERHKRARLQVIELDRNVRPLDNHKLNRGTTRGCSRSLKPGLGEVAVAPVSRDGNHLDSRWHPQDQLLPLRDERENGHEAHTK